MLRNAPRKNTGGMSLAPWLGVVLLAVGLGAGWAARAYLGRSEADTLAECPKLPEPAPAPVCPTVTEAEPTDGQRLPVYTSEVTGEGVIEFKFYGPDGTEVTRKWITRIPLSAPQTPPAPESEETDTPEATDEKSAAHTAEKTEAASTKVAAKPESKTTPSAKPKDPKPTTKTTASKSTKGKGKFTVQTGAYKDRESAEAQVAKLERRGFDARIEKAVITGKGTWYRVRIGSSLAQSDANAMAAKIRKATGLEASAVTQ